MANVQICIECERRKFCYECRYAKVIIPPEYTKVSREEYQRLTGKVHTSPTHVAVKGV